MFSGLDFASRLDYRPAPGQTLRAAWVSYPLSVQKIVEKEAAIDADQASQLVKLAHMTCNLKGPGLDEGASIRLLVHAGKLIASGIAPVTACRSAIAEALTDDPDMLSAVNELSSSLF